MKFTISGLKKFLETNASLEQLIDKLLQIGFEVEEVINQAEIYKPFVIAEIISATQHPEADKLRVCQVNTGKETLQIVCGAPNARAGIKVVLAPVGTEIPANKLIIKESKIRNINSCGMLCSGKELAISDEHDGIIELSDEYIVGSSFAESHGLNEVLIEIAVGPNRGDCLGVYGIARELAAGDLGTLKPLNTKKINGTFDSPIKPLIENPQVAPKYIGRYFKNIKNCDTPLWLKNYLESIGQKSISALVDITNYFTFVFGRPLHVYDADKVSSIELRKATKGEKFIALNDKEYALFDEDYCLADGNKVIGLPGIIGEKNSGAYLDSKNIFLEIALFDADEVAKIARRHQIDTDAKFRFERKLDPNFLETALDLASEMIMEICGGEPSNPVIIENSKAPEKAISFSTSIFRKILGVDYQIARVKEILLSLGFKIIKESSDNFEVIVPSWRNDVSIKEDLVEEIARIDGYQNIPPSPMHNENYSLQILTNKQKNNYRIARFAASLGLTETISFTFMNSKKAALFTALKDECYLKNPISSELDYLRPSLLPNLLEAALKNQNRNYTDIGLFEFESIYKGIHPEDQMLSLSGLRVGYNNEKNIYGDHRKIDAFDAKSDILRILAEFGFDSNKLQLQTSNLPKYYHPGRSAALSLGKVILGYFGEIHPNVLKEYELENTAVGFEIFVDNIPLSKPKYGRKGSLEFSDYQAVKRDFAFLVDKHIEVEQIYRLVSQTDKKLIKEISIFDIYQGKNIAEGQKSVAFSVALQAQDHTLTENEIDSVSNKIIEAISANLGGILRN